MFLPNHPKHMIFFPGVEMLVIRKLQALQLSGKQTWQRKSQIVAKRKYVYIDGVIRHCYVKIFNLNLSAVQDFDLLKKTSSI